MPLSNKPIMYTYMYYDISYFDRGFVDISCYRFQENNIFFYAIK